MHLQKKIQNQVHTFTFDDHDDDDDDDNDDEHYPI